MPCFDELGLPYMTYVKWVVLAEGTTHTQQTDFQGVLRILIQLPEELKLSIKYAWLDTVNKSISCDFHFLLQIAAKFLCHILRIESLNPYIERHIY